MFPLLSWWIIRMRLPAGFKLPRWASASFNNALTAFLALILEGTVPLLGKALVGLFIGLQSLVFLSMVFWAVCGVVFWAGRHLGRITERVPTDGWRPLLQVTDGWVGLVPFVLFWVWGLFYLAGDHYHVVNRVCLAVWALFWVAGCVLASLRWLREWALSRSAPPGAV